MPSKKASIHDGSRFRGTASCAVVETAQDAEDVAAICKKHALPSQVIGYVEGAHGKEVSLPEKGLKGTGQKFQSV